jgi:prevent-host-death family protein
MKLRSTVGVRDFRARLSAYLRNVAAGGSVTISNRRRQPIARLVPVRQSSESDVLDRLADRGVVRRGVGKPGHSPRVKPRKARRSLSDLVIEDRR